mmetsp:Transcript_20296/g.41795  ORF Transcript_20296/g.41795 Transcript_20296/m.41795 type:complete len:571 (-) Transcript_20296:70-1782(-)
MKKAPCINCFSPLHRASLCTLMFLPSKASAAMALPPSRSFSPAVSPSRRFRFRGQGHMPLLASSTNPSAMGKRATSCKPLSSASSQVVDDRDMLDPYDILRGLQKKSSPGDDADDNDDSTTLQKVKIPHPTHLSPTSLETFKKCPQAFFFLYILKLKPDPPITPELARGILCHKALEDIFDLTPEDRTLDNLQNLFRKEWKGKRGVRNSVASGEHMERLDENDDSQNDESYDCLFRIDDGRQEEYGSIRMHDMRNNDDDASITTSSYDIEEEIKWGQYSLRLLHNYYQLEDPRKVQPPNPLMKEMWVNAKFNLNANSSMDDDDDYNDDNHEEERDNNPEESKLGRDSIIVRGKIDRIDMHYDPSNNKIHLRIIDYKTGKKPNFKYSPSVNERIANEQFWKMKIYALILWKMILRAEKMNSHNYGSADQREGYKYGIPWMFRQKLLQAMDETRDRQKWSEIIELHSLKLVYLTSHADDASLENGNGGGGSIGPARYLDFSLGSNPSEFQSILDEMQNEIESVGREIVEMVDLQDPKAFQHCDWKYCSCHEFRRRFRGDTVWSREREGGVEW